MVISGSVLSSPRNLTRTLGGVFSGGFYASQQCNLETRLPPLMTSEQTIDHQPKRALRELAAWLKKHRPEAILTTNRMTPALMARLGLHIPDDVAMAGTSISDISLSAGINQNSLEIGRAAVETLVSLINNNDRGRPTVPRRILIEGFWQDGDSLPPRK